MEKPRTARLLHQLLVFQRVATIVASWRSHRVERGRVHPSFGT